MQQAIPPPTEGTQRTKTKTKGSNDLIKQQRMWGWFFLSPWIIGFLAFTIVPMIASLVFSFMEFNLARPDEIQWIGLDNYRNLFNDPLFGVSLAVTFRFAIISLPIGMILPIAIAALMNSEYLIGKRFFRTLFYMPYIVPIVSAVYIWQGMLGTETGWLNRVLEWWFGVEGPRWLDSTTWIYPALVIMGLWGIGNAYLITLASMQGVPTQLYEAAKVDGATALRRFYSITLPMISPVVFFNLILSVIGLLRYFEVPFILKSGTGQPGQSTLFYNIHFYKTTFVFLDMGYGSTLAWVLFAITMVLTILLFATARYWVYYASEENVF
ncbi:MAG: sugar ABC transporter permease [Chloroflexota bacterium]